MSDLISRKAAIGTLDDEITIVGKSNAYVVKDYVQRVKKKMENLPSAELEPVWIPCSKRLPDKAGEYLVTYHPCYWDSVEPEKRVGIDTFRGKTSWAKKKYQRVIAWAKLPEVYEEEGRQAAIDAIHDLFAIYGSEGSWIDQKDAFKAILNLPSADRWISVTKALPEIKDHQVSDTVIVFCDNGNMGFSYLEENIFGQAGWNCEREDDYHEPLGEVLAWMPLPEPYQAERKEE